LTFNRLIVLIQLLLQLLYSPAKWRSCNQKNWNHRNNWL